MKLGDTNGKLFCHISVVFISIIQTTKMHSYDIQSMYKPIFNLFSEVVYPEATTVCILKII